MNAEGKRAGVFVISLDFELYWGMTDKVSLSEYGENILGVRTVIPRMLQLFAQYGIHATWATVGMLTFDSKKELQEALPELKPQYENKTLSNYTHLQEGSVGENETSDPYHFGASLVRMIQQSPEQEIASHTFSHYYCREAGQTIDTFRADCEAEQKALARYNVHATSLVLPRNQWCAEYLPVMQQHGITAFRGNQSVGVYAPRAEHKQTSPLIRALRLLDHYLPLFGAHIYTDGEMQKTTPHNIPASIFFRPYNPKLALLEPLRLWRIKTSMTKAAKEGKLFHLWWHPHNFGKHIERNMQNLENVLQHYATLQTRYGMKSRSMQEVSHSLSHV